MMRDARLYDRAERLIRELARPEVVGRVTRVTGLLVEARVPGASIGDVVEIERSGGNAMGEVVGFKESVALIIPYHQMRHVAPGARVRSQGHGTRLGVSDALLGRIVDPFAKPLDEGEMASPDHFLRLDAEAPAPGLRVPIRERMDTGIKLIDSLLTCGRGQRIGIFAGAGVGKTVLIRQIARQCEADVVVIGLIGERGCEVQDLISSYEMDRTALVVATSDRSPMERARGALAATATAEYFRDQGKNVLLIVDSLTRYAMALREIGLAAGEPPATKGYPPSVFASMPRLLERVCPMRAGGSITAFYTVLVEGDDMSDPVADAARSLLDAHIVLSRDRAGRGLFPAVDVLASASRVVRQVTSRDDQGLAQKARTWLSVLHEAEELKSMGAYIPGHNPTYDAALESGDLLQAWACQDAEEAVAREAGLEGLAKVLSQIEKRRDAKAARRAARVKEVSA